mgnify:CR=1 FL=1
MISDKILKKVSKPGRYIGGEYGQILKDKKDIKRRLDEALNAMEETTYYTVVTFDLATFN